MRPHDGKPLPGFKPGQYLTFQLNIPGKDKPTVRCYSLSDGPRGEYYRVSIKRCPAPRGKPDIPPGLSSNFFHDHVKEGDILDVRAPGGHFFLDLEATGPIVLIGGGIGITPVLSMLNTLVADGTLKRQVHFFLGVRNSKDHPMKAHLEELNKLHDNLTLHVCYSGPEDKDVKDRDYQHGERVSIDLFKRVLPSNNFDFYLCGPPPMMESVVPGLEEWGVPEVPPPWTPRPPPPRGSSRRSPRPTGWGRSRPPRGRRPPCRPARAHGRGGASRRERGGRARGGRPDAGPGTDFEGGFHISRAPLGVRDPAHSRSRTIQLPRRKARPASAGSHRLLNSS
jgi:ferredoxin-NADP reductase